jgi:hypothetical protein
VPEVPEVFGVFEINRSQKPKSDIVLHICKFPNSKIKQDLYHIAEIFLSSLLLVAVA